MLNRRVELKDSWEYVLERMAKIFTRLAFVQLCEETKRARRLSGSCADFQRIKWVSQSKRMLAAWKRLTKIGREILPQLVQRHEEHLVRGLFGRMKQLALHDAESQRNKGVRLNKKLRQLRLRLLWTTLCESTRVSKQLKNGKSRACHALLLRLAEKSARKLRHCVRLLRQLSFAGEAFGRVARTMELHLGGESLARIKHAAAVVKQKELRATRFLLSQTAKLRRACFQEFKQLSTRTTSLLKLGGVFSKLHLQFSCKGILTSWAKYTLVDPQSMFQKSVKAREHSRLSQKRRAFWSLAREVSSQQEKRGWQKHSAVAKNKLARVFGEFVRVLGRDRDRERLQRLRKVFEDFRMAVELTKQDRDVDEVMREEESASRVQDVARKRNDRFMMLLDMGRGGELFAGGRPQRGGFLGGDRLGEGTVFTSEAGTDDFDDKEIKSAF